MAGMFWGPERLEEGNEGHDGAIQHWCLRQGNLGEKDWEVACNCVFPRICKAQKAAGWQLQPRTMAGLGGSMQEPAELQACWALAALEVLQELLQVRSVVPSKGHLQEPLVLLSTSQRRLLGVFMFIWSKTGKSGTGWSFWT